jgi:GT2 family glycosyltransferase
MSSEPTVTVLLLTLNQREHTLAALRSLSDAAYPACRVLLVDSASQDGTAEAVAEAFPETEIVRLVENRGCAGGRNLGLRRALEYDTEFIFFLDNDCLVDRHAIAELVRAAQRNPGAAIFTPKTYWWPDAQLLYSTGCIIDWRRGFTPMRGQNEIDHGQYDKAPAVDCAGGGLSFFRAEVGRVVGGPDEDYYNMYEDPDWCMRAKRKGFDCVFVPEARVWHNHKGRGRPGAAWYFYRARNRPLFMKRNAPRRYRVAFWPHYWRDTAEMLYMLRRTGQYEQARSLWQGVRAYFRQEWGPASR